MLRTSAPLIGALDGINVTDRMRKLDQMLGESRWHKPFLYGACVVFAGLVAWVQSPPIGKTTEVSGTALTVFGLPSDQTSPIFITVRLDSGLMVKARIYDFNQFQKGGRVHLLKQEALIFGAPRYILNSQDRFPGK